MSYLVSKAVEWGNLPLNESFATYGEYLWQEYKYGLDAADHHSVESRAGYLAESDRKQVNLIRFQYSDKEDMFDGHSYNKGGQVLHMLRKYVGDDAFFASLKLYLETNKFTSVEISPHLIRRFKNGSYKSIYQHATKQNPTNGGKSSPLGRGFRGRPS